jgi:LacI family transcriptional regulator
MQQPDMTTHRSVTIKDIARHCGVHFVTVSRALRSVPRVSPATVQAIVRAAEELGYDAATGHAGRHLVARGHHTQVRNNVIGLCFPPNFVRHAYFADLFEGIIEELTQAGITIHLIPTYSPELPTVKLSSVPEVLRRGETDGALITRWPEQYGSLVEMLRSEPNFGNRPIVSLLCLLPGCSAVITDDYAGAYAAMHYLLNLGHRRILHFLFPEFDTFPSPQRYAAIRQACCDYGVDPDHLLIYAAMDWETTVSRRMGKPLHRALAQHPDITAILAPNDLYAVQIADVLHAMGYTVPDDVSLVGFDDVIPLLNTTRENMLTTVRLPLETVGRESARLLVQRIQGAIPDEHISILPTELVIRHSTAPPRGR